MDLLNSTTFFSSVSPEASSNSEKFEPDSTRKVNIIIFCSASLSSNQEGYKVTCFSNAVIHTVLNSVITD